MSVRLAGSRLPVGVLVLALLAVSAGCRFDESGLEPAAGGQDAAGGDGSRPDAGPDSVVDAPWPDAAVPCLDGDEDGFEAPAWPEAECAGPADCDDLDPDAYPGQPDAFTEPRQSGGFDYDCDGVESPALDTSAGADCYWDWFTCRGTGWYGGVPGCGEQGIWHRCAPDGYRCEEDGSDLVRMSCR